MIYLVKQESRSLLPQHEQQTLLQHWEGPNPSKLLIKNLPEK